MFRHRYAIDEFENVLCSDALRGMHAGVYPDHRLCGAGELACFGLSQVLGQGQSLGALPILIEAAHILWRTDHRHQHCLCIRGLTDLLDDQAWRFRSQLSPIAHEL